MNPWDVLAMIDLRCDDRCKAHESPCTLSAHRGGRRLCRCAECHRRELEARRGAR